MSFETVSVIGLGYIGLPTAAMFAAYGKQVIGIDVNRNVVETINRGEIHIVEPELDAMVQKAVNDGRLTASTSALPADAFLVAVPTPFKGSNHEPDLAYIESATNSIAKVLKKGDLVVLESTSPVGTTEQMASWLQQLRPDLTFPQTHGEDSDIRVAHCPERVLPGHVVRELVENDRVIGGLTSRCSERAIELYKIFVQGDCIVTSARTAEMAKLTENAFRDVNIAFANELSVICDQLDINVWELIKLSNRHPRVNILNPGAGVGGHCIAVDPWFIVSKTPKLSNLIHAARNVNDNKPVWILEKVKAAISTYLQTYPEKSEKDVKVACYGISFKPDIDDLRESPALAITKEICKFNSGTTMIIEPNISDLQPYIRGSRLVSLDAATKEADIHVLLVAHKEFHNLRGLKGIVIDAVGIM